VLQFDDATPRRGAAERCKGATAIGATSILLEILGGAALLLWGVRMVRTGFSRAFGASLRHAVGASCRNRFSAFLVGLGATALLQSSTATALMTTSFTGRGLVQLAPATAVMLGANVGTALVAQVLSFDLGVAFAILLLAGVAAFMATENNKTRNLGRVAIGLGLMLVSLRLIMEASAPLQGSVALHAMLESLGSAPAVAALVGALLAWLAHSSLAIVLLAMSLAGAGATDLSVAFALVLGANLGGAVAPVVMTLGAPPGARRVALGNLLIRGVGVAVAVPCLGFVAPLLQQLEADPARQVVNLHAAFNLALAVAFLPLIRWVAALCARLAPDEPAGEAPDQPRYLDDQALETPAVALASAARETLRMGDMVEEMLRRSIEVLHADDARLAREVERMDDAVDALHEAIKLYLTKLRQSELDEAESRRYVEILTFTTNLEHMGDIIDKNLMELAAKKIRRRLAFSDEGWREIVAFHGLVLDNLRLSFNVFISGDLKAARRLFEEKVRLRDAERAAGESHIARLREGRPQTVESSALHLDLIRDLKRIHDHLVSAAYPILEAAGELRASRLRETAADAPPLSGLAAPHSGA
jgi:phosphate:Na+ symporter